MKKAVFINLKDVFSAYALIESKTFEPVFEDWSETLLDNITDYSLIVFYQKVIDVELITAIRKKIAFHNIKVLLFTDSIDLDLKKKAMLFGADFVELLPLSDEELISQLSDIRILFDKSKFFNESKLTPFILSTQEILSMMAVLSVEIDEVYLNTSPFHYGDVSAIMALAGEKKGVIMISFYESLSKRIISSIMGATLDELSEEEHHDGVGEIINMIAGGAKARLGDSDAHFLLSAPTVITGNQHRVIQQKDIPCVVMVFKVEEECFAVQLCLNTLGYSE
jgi:chemotaxis protein CheX